MTDIYDQIMSTTGSNVATASPIDGEETEDGYTRHPLFPREDEEPESRDIRFISFRRRRTDGRVDSCPEDIPAHLVQSWGQVILPWGGGEYKAIGKDRNHRIVA